MEYCVEPQGLEAPSIQWSQHCARGKCSACDCRTRKCPTCASVSYRKRDRHLTKVCLFQHCNQQSNNTTEQQLCVPLFWSACVRPSEGSSVGPTDLRPKTHNKLGFERRVAMTKTCACLIAIYYTSTGSCFSFHQFPFKSNFVQNWLRWSSDSWFAVRIFHGGQLRRNSEAPPTFRRWCFLSAQLIQFQAKDTWAQSSSREYLHSRIQVAKSKS